MIKFAKLYLPDYHFQVDLARGNEVLAVYLAKRERFLPLLKFSEIDAQRVTPPCISWLVLEIFDFQKSVL